MISFPKIELHCHLDGSMGLAVIRQLLLEKKRVVFEEELPSLLQAPRDCDSLATYLKRFALPIDCIQTKEGLQAAAYDLALTAAKEEVKYLEVRFAPAFSTSEGLSVITIIEQVQKGLMKAEEEADIKTGIIVCGMRNLSMENNLAMLKEARELLGAGVVATDLAGDEKAYPTKDYQDYFKLAKKLDIPYTIHGGECGSKENIKTAIDFGAKRIGHGIAMSKDLELMKRCRDKQIGVELCPTSNFQTKAVIGWENYPFMEFFKQDIPLSINTDNRTVSNTNMTREWEEITNHYSLSNEDLKKIYLQSIDMAFASDSDKQDLIRKWSL